MGLVDGGVSAVTQGVAAWTNHPDSIIRYTYAGSAPAVLNCTNGDEQGAVWFNDPCDEIPDLSGCSGTLAFGGAFFSLGTAPHDGELWHPASATFVVVNNGTQCIGDVNFREMMTHEARAHPGLRAPRGRAAAEQPHHVRVAQGGRPRRRPGGPRQDLRLLRVPHVPRRRRLNHSAWRFVEAVENAGVTGGCARGNYCPDATVSREQMAVFLLLAREGAGYTPPACITPPFNDVPLS